MKFPKNPGLSRLLKMIQKGQKSCSYLERKNIYTTICGEKEGFTNQWMGHNEMIIMTHCWLERMADGRGVETVRESSICAILLLGLFWIHAIMYNMVVKLCVAQFIHFVFLIFSNVEAVKSKNFTKGSKGCVCFSFFCFRSKFS